MRDEGLRSANRPKPSANILGRHEGGVAAYHFEEDCLQNIVLEIEEILGANVTSAPEFVQRFPKYVAEPKALSPKPELLLFDFGGVLIEFAGPAELGQHLR